MQSLLRKTGLSLLIIIVTLAACLLSGCTASSDNVCFGTDYSLQLSGSKSNKHAKEIDTLFSTLENRLSSAVLSSDVGKINSAAVGTPVQVGQDFAALYALSTAYYNQYPSFNPFIFPLVQLWKFDPSGYTLSPASIPTDTQITDTLKVCNKDSFSFNSDTNTITKLVEGAKLDFGAVAKGYAADKAAQIAANNKYIIDVGGTIRTNKSIRIAIQSPRGGGYAASFTLNNASVATSGDYERTYIYNGTRYHHIIDTTGYPAGLTQQQPIISVTIVGAEAAICDILSTLVFIEGENCRPLLNELNYSALILTQDTYTVIGDIEFELIEQRTAA